MLRIWLASLILLLLGSCHSPASHSINSIIRIRWERDPETLDPLALPNQQAIDVANLLSPSLLAVDLQSGQYAPALAARLPDEQLLGTTQLRLDYHLRPEATWDDGQPVTAADVAFTLKLLHCPGLPHELVRTQVEFIADSQPDPADPRHLVLTCQGQSPEYRLASGDFPIVAEHLLDPTYTLRKFSLAEVRRGSAASQPALAALAALAARYQQAAVARHPGHLPGCGPYQLVSWQPNRTLLFRRKAHWWADKLRPAPFVLTARARQLQFVVLPDAGAAALAMQRRELEVFPQVPARVFQRLQASGAGPELQFSTTPAFDVATVGFNLRRPALQHRLTRQALGCLLDAPALRQATQLGQGVLTASLVPPGSYFYNDSLPLPRYNPTRAAALLARAGWRRTPAGWQRPGQSQPLRLTLRYRTDDAQYAALALQWQAAAAQLGIPIELRPTESSVFAKALHNGDFDLYGRPVRASPFALDFSPLLHSGAAGNLTGFGQPDTDRLLEAIAAIREPARKRWLLRQLQARLYEEVPVLPLFFTASRVAASRQLRPLVVSGVKPGYVAAALAWADGDSLDARR